MLITAEQLRQEQTAGAPLLVLDCRFAMPNAHFDADYGRNQYLQNHIPGALYVDLEKDLTATPSPETGRHPLPASADFIEKLQRWGLQPGIKVVVYDDCGALIAARLWWMLRYWIGHENTAVLDGGFPAWRLMGLPLEEKVNIGVPSSYRYSFATEHLKSTVDIQQMLSQKRSHVLVDARGHTRFTGQEEPIDPIAGHIPGALNLPCVDNLSADGKFLPPRQLRMRFTKLLSKVGHANEIIHSCGSGVTACHNILAMERSGISGTCLYAGSWSEWIRNPDNPTATGE